MSSDCSSLSICVGIYTGVYQTWTTSIRTSATCQLTISQSSPLAGLGLDRLRRFNAAHHLPINLDMPVGSWCGQSGLPSPIA
jgi:hypothetical protein